jgi:hypothetical protein
VTTSSGDRREGQRFGPASVGERHDLVIDPSQFVASAATMRAWAYTLNGGVIGINADF